MMAEHRGNDEAFDARVAECRANARLIAAAPELLAALKALAVGREMIVSHHMWPEVQTAMAVIAKAEGGLR